MKKVFSLFLIVQLSACGISTPIKYSTGKLGRLSPGMAKSEAMAVYGDPISVRADINSVEVHEYVLYPPGTAGFDLFFCPITLTIACWIPSPGQKERWWLQYENGKLVRWGTPWDWKPAPDNTQEIRLR